MEARAVALGGDLRLISLFDLGQVLRLNGVTGCLALQDGSRKGALYFDRGELINAVDDACHVGETAAVALFGWRAGTFEFRPESLPGSRVIESGTEAVMMEAARRLDEAAAGTGEDGGSSEARRLREHQTAMETLRDVFRRVAGEARERHSGVDALATTAHLYELLEAEDRLLYRPGHPPFMRQRGRWSPVPEPPLARSDYDELRTRLADACDPGAPAGGDPGPSRRMTLADGRVLAMEELSGECGESLWLRPAGAGAIEDEIPLAGDLITLNELIGLPEALLLLGAADLGTARRLLAGIARLAAGPADTLVVVSADGRFRPRTEAGVTVATEPERLRAVLDGLRPDIVALDPDLGVEAVALDDLATVPRILAALAGHGAGSLAVRWLFRVRCRQPQPARAWLCAMLAGLVTARAAHDAPSALMVSAWPLETVEREMALRGDAAALTRRLAAMLTR